MTLRSLGPLLALCLVVLAVPPVDAARASSAPGVVTDTSGWIPWEHAARPALAGSALDMSGLLDAPAGRHGFLTVRGDRFVFEDGTPARFWGGNFFGEADFPEKEDAERLADIVARAGANIIRLHHVDVVAPWTDKVVQRSLFGGQQPETTRKLDPEMLDRFEYLIHCLKERGVYVFLSHLSSRMVRPGDGFPGPWEAAEEIGWGLKFEGMFDPFLIELQKEYLAQLLTHVNPYTGLPLVSDPVLAMTEVVNENTTLWPQEDGAFALTTDYYRNMLRAQFGAWLLGEVGDRRALAARWAPAEGEAGLAESEDPATSSVAIPPTYRDRDRHRFSETRIRDTFRFLAELQGRYFDTMRQHLKAVGLRVPLTGSNHWLDDVVDLHQNAGFDYVDRHEYWTHPEGSYNYEKGQGIDPLPLVKDAGGGMIGGLARRRVYGRPYTVSEWHACLPNPYRAEGTPVMAAYASLQGWHPMHYAYWGVTDAAPAMINSFEVMFDPTQMNLIPASALLFLRGDVREAPTGYYDVVEPERLLDPLQGVERHPEVALYGKYGLAFPDVATPEKNDDRLLQQATRGRDSARVSSTGQLEWDPERGLVTVNTARTQGIVGFAGGEHVETRGAAFDLTTPFGVVLLSALDDRELTDSARILVSTSADARWTGVEVSETGDEILSTGRWPFLMQPVEGRLFLASDRPATVYRLATSGARLGELAVEKAPGGIVIPLSAANGCMHYEIIREP
ncbi:MAG: hypothetical protein LJF30_13515 [Acidobacteria bacterium]|jgi:hypothetical protein|nr:hypothetical protein [Acidobacteriota bacterium]